jgi:hypothetical protein
MGGFYIGPGIVYHLCTTKHQHIEANINGKQFYRYHVNGDWGGVTERRHQMDCCTLFVGTFLSDLILEFHICNVLQVMGHSSFIEGRPSCLLMCLWYGALCFFD